MTRNGWTGWANVAGVTGGRRRLPGYRALKHADLTE
jgi:hypothetical protein